MSDNYRIYLNTRMKQLQSIFINIRFNQFKSVGVLNDFVMWVVIIIFKFVHLPHSLLHSLQIKWELSTHTPPMVIRLGELLLLREHHLPSRRSDPLKNQKIKMSVSLIKKPSTNFKRLCKTQKGKTISRTLTPMTQPTRLKGSCPLTSKMFKTV